MWKLFFIFLLVTFVVVRWFFPEGPVDQLGPRALFELTYSLSLLGFVYLLAGGAGLRVLRWLKLDHITRIERAVLGLPIGLGICAFGVMGLGFLGFLFPETVLIWLGMVTLLCWREMSEIANQLPIWFSEALEKWRNLDAVGRSFCVAIALLFSLTLLLALTPPWDYDGLMYHLQGPRLFLQTGRIMLLPDNWQANFPFTIEMLFTIGLVFGSEPFAKLIHLSFTVLLVWATYSCGKRFFAPDGGKVAAIVLLGIPGLPLWASWANIDIGWALFEFLAVYAFLIWVETNRRTWLVLSGVFMGLALGSKYLALGGMVALGLLIITYSRSSGVKPVVTNGLIFGLTSLSIGFPWYLKNWILGGNPLYPLFFGGAGWPSERVEWLMAYLHSFGTGKGLLDYLLLPWNLYAQPERFATFPNIIELSPLFPLAFFFPWSRNSKYVWVLSLSIILRFLMWAIGSQQTRLLLPIFPCLSLLTGQVLLQFVKSRFGSRIGRIIVYGISGGALTATLLMTILYIIYIRPIPVVIGLETKADFLKRMVDNYRSIEFIRSVLPSQARVLMMWDGQGYYCDERCLPSPEQSQWSQLAASAPSVASLSVNLRARGITHLLFSLSDADYFQNHDPTGKHRRAIAYFNEEFQAACTKEIYKDQMVSIYQLSCP